MHNASFTLSWKRGLESFWSVFLLHRLLRYFVFLSVALSVDSRTRLVRRHHLDPIVLQRRLIIMRCTADGNFSNAEFSDLTGRVLPFVSRNSEYNQRSLRFYCEVA
jgi:hypothetical protein